MNDTIILASAASFAAEAHKGQVRKDLNEPYIVHPLRVGHAAAKLGMTVSQVAAAYLHDVVEDTPTPLPTVYNLFGQEIGDLVKALTKPWRDEHSPSDVDKDAYYHLILNTPGALDLKMLDRIDNLNDFRRMAAASVAGHKWAENYARKTRKEFAPLVATYRAGARMPLLYQRALEILEEAL
jgi:(p)ppGpp synthase/HD superfamily hydrolase